ncbi:MAG TPA: type II secretion system secretin GspD [Rudaea sp.]|nr:type II secretion system secretin GspD [Rudaea sp.]
MSMRACLAAVLLAGAGIVPVRAADTAAPAIAPGSPAVAARPAAEPANPPGTHTLNLKDADIQALIYTVSEITGKNFIIGPNVQGKVTVVSSHPMKPDEIYDVFLSVLRVHGYAAIPAGSMIKIVPEAMAQQDGSGGLDGTRGHEADELITQIVPVKHISATELVPILRPLMPQGAQLIAHAGSNSLVISDRAGNVARMVSIIERIDTVSDAGVEVIPLQHANAAEVARTLSQLAEVKGATDMSGDTPRIFADERTNSILLSGGKSGRLRMRALITHLDTPIANGGDTQVVYLSYANAKDLVPILQGVAATLTGEAVPGKGAAAANAAVATNAATGSAGAATATIQAHEEDNALVISAPPAVYRSLLAVIRQLDIRRAQVLIEAVIAEVSDETANELGVQWQFPLGDKSHVVGGTNFTGNTFGNNILNATAGLNASTPTSTVGNGFNLGYFDTITVNGKKLLSLGALISALRSDGKNNILSTPSVMTLDNQEAMIKVGQEVPFLTGSYTTNTGGSTTTTANGSTTTNGIGNPFQTIQRKDVGLTLKVTPHINSGDAVKLDLHQEVSTVLPPVPGAVDLVTSKRELETTVLVKNDSLLVLGGLISDNVKDSVQKVPALGDIPLIGNLFRYRSNDHQKQDLMVFLHPRILKDKDFTTEATVSAEKYNYIRTEQLEMRENTETITPRAEQPMLPEVHDFLASPPLDVAPKDARPERRP